MMLKVMLTGGLRLPLFPSCLCCNPECMMLDAYIPSSSTINPAEFVMCALLPFQLAAAGSSLVFFDQWPDHHALFCMDTKVYSNSWQPLQMGPVWLA